MTTTDPEPEPTVAEIEMWEREDLFIPAAEATDDAYPRLHNISAGFFCKAIVRPDHPTVPEYIALRMDRSSVELQLAVGQWNMLWESGQFRRRFFEDLPDEMGKFAEVGDVNLIVVPRTRTRYYEYAPMLHLLSRRTLEHFGLPLLRAGQWPFLANRLDVDKYLPADFEDRLARAWAWEVWPHLNSGSGLRAFTRDDPIRLLAHNLDFWLPPVTSTVQDILHRYDHVHMAVNLVALPRSATPFGYRRTQPDCSCFS